MKARQISGACAAAIVLLTAGAVTSSGAAMADDRQSPDRIAVCSTGPVYRSSHVDIDITCRFRIDVDVDRHRSRHDTADYTQSED
jgi:hypothetical protein